MTTALSFHPTWDQEIVRIAVQQARSGIFSAWVQRGELLDLTNLSSEYRALAMALADTRGIADELGDNSLKITPNSIQLSHELAASLPGAVAETIGLPPVVDMVLRTDAEGLIGSSQFKLRYEWFDHGVRQLPRRQGCILETARGLRRIPIWMMQALDIADGFASTGDDGRHWEALARFRSALEPESAGKDNMQTAAAMTDFLRNLEVRIADRFSLSHTGDDTSGEFEVVPFSGRTLEAKGREDGGASEDDAELSGSELSAFQRRVRERGALPAYRTGERSYLVVDRSAAPVLQVMARMQHASPEDRRAFLQNPRPRINEAVEAAMRASGQLDGLNAAGEEEAIEAIAGPAFVETLEYSQRVIGVSVFMRPDLGLGPTGSTTWLPEFLPAPIAKALADMDVAGLEHVRDNLRSAMERGVPTVSVEGMALAATPDVLRSIEARIEIRRIDDVDPTAAKTAEKEEGQPKEEARPLILETADNFFELNWRPGRPARSPAIPASVPTLIKTPLKTHQSESLDWQCAAWTSGLPGILNADEQGLGKTLQTIAFLVWLRNHMEACKQASERKPLLVVAPTSLLENWEKEVEGHTRQPGLGHLVRLYGTSIQGRKLANGPGGVDTDHGQPSLDFGWLEEALQEGRAHRYWVLTTYTTLTNYQHSLARIPFAAVVFDEIQAIKNPASLRAHAARAINADFRIGLTGTPIENSTIDLWAILDQLAPGSVGTLKEFQTQYGTPEKDRLAELHSAVFRSRRDYPALALRRMKETVARDLPTKSRRLHPRLMPEIQAVAYEDARAKLAAGHRGAALKILHHIRGVSVHPSMASKDAKDAYIAASARLEACFDILRRIRDRSERALVFIESIQMQYRFIELARQEFGLDGIDLINGQTPIQKRQAIVDKFQRHKLDDGGFDLLVLGPKAAGTGLTLTAATHVIHLSRWWNPAVEEQCNDRVHRLGQDRPVTVHMPMAIHPGYREDSFDCLLHSLMQRKRSLATSALWPMGDTQDDAAMLQSSLSNSERNTVSDPLLVALEAMFERDRIAFPGLDEERAVSIL